MVSDEGFSCGALFTRSARIGSVDLQRMYVLSRQYVVSCMYIHMSVLVFVCAHVLI